jgi:hypothetical protein
MSSGNMAQWQAANLAFISTLSYVASEQGEAASSVCFEV